MRSMQTYHPKDVDLVHTQSRLPNDQRTQRDKGHTMSSVRPVPTHPGTPRTHRRYPPTQLDTRHTAHLRTRSLIDILCTQSKLGSGFSHWGTLCRHRSVQLFLEGKLGTQYCAHWELVRRHIVYMYPLCRQTLADMASKQTELRLAECLGHTMYTTTLC